MSQLTHPRIFSLTRRFRLWLAVAAVALVAAIPTVIVLSNDDSGQSSKAAPVAHGATKYEQPGQATSGRRP